MSKFCFKCGGVSENDAPVCARCGAAFGDTPIPVVEEPVPAETAPVEATPAEAPVRRRRTPPAKKSKKHLVIAVAIIAVVIFAFTGVVTMVGALGYFLFFAPEYTDPIDLYFAAMYEGKVENVEKLAPKAYWDWRAEATDSSRDTCIEEAQEWASLTSKSIKKQFGDDFFCTYEVADKEELSDEDLRELAEILERDYDISAKSVKKGYTVTIDLNFNGDEQKGQKITVVQIGHRWYLVEHFNSAFGDRAYFPVGGGPAMLG